jgi:hypothetical protein
VVAADIAVGRRVEVLIPADQCQARLVVAADIVVGRRVEVLIPADQCQAHLMAAETEAADREEGTPEAGRMEALLMGDTIAAK